MGQDSTSSPDQATAAEGLGSRASRWMRLELQQADQPLRKLDTMANRLAFSIIVAVMIIASAMILASEQAVSIVGSPVAIIWTALGVIMGAWLLYSIIRSGRL